MYYLLQASLLHYHHYLIMHGIFYKAYFNVQLTVVKSKCAV